MDLTREVAFRLYTEFHEIEILQKGTVVDESKLQELKGPIRLRMKKVMDDS
jgi:hypothetical protein